jgi:predicted esterase
MVAHGAGGRGEHHCDFWNERLPLDVWIVCPQGSLLDRRDPSGGAYFPNHHALQNELRAVSQTLLELDEAKIQTEDWTFIGYSQGATMGALAIVSPKEADERERRFTRLLLIEGGGEYWTRARATSFKNAGGRSVTLVCGTNGCGSHARRSVPVFEKAELDGTFIDAPHGGHTYGGKVAVALAPEIEKMFY